MGTDQNGDESGERMVSGGDTILRKSGICAGKDTGINQIEQCRGKLTAREVGTRIILIGAEQTSMRTLCPRQGARGLLMDGTAVESAFALLLTKVTKPPYPAKVS